MWSLLFRLLVGFECSTAGASDLQKTLVHAAGARCCEDWSRVGGRMTGRQEQTFSNATPTFHLI